MQISSVDDCLVLGSPPFSKLPWLHPGQLGSCAQASCAMSSQDPHGRVLPQNFIITSPCQILKYRETSMPHESQCFSWAYTTRGSCERYVQATSPLHHSPRRENHLQPLWTRRHCRLSDVLSDVSVQKLHPAAPASKSPQKNQARSRINPT